MSTTALRTVRHRIGGEETPGASTRTAPVFDPATGEQQAEVLLAEREDVDAAVQEGIKLTIVLVQNHGFASIGALSESLGSQRFGTRYRYRDAETGRLDGDTLPVDLAANAASLGADVLWATTIEEFELALRDARDRPRTTVVHVVTDPLAPAPSSEAWWDVPVAEVAELESTRTARATYEQSKQTQRTFLSTREQVTR